MKIIKKIFVILSFLSLFALCGCKNKNTGNTSGVDYTKYDALVAKDFDAFTLKVRTEKDGETLNGQYTVTPVNTGKKITYSYQQINEIKEENGEYVFPDEYKSTLTGEMIIDGNTVLSQNGAELNVSFEKISSIGLEFDESFFANVTQTEKSFTADVINPSGYLGQTLNCSQMTTTLRFIGEELIKIELSYLSESGASVYIEYAF